MLTWAQDLDWSKIAEWLSILGVGFMVMFRLGKFSKTQERDHKECRKDIRRHEKLLMPDDPGNDIIRQHDLNQFEKLFLAHEERLRTFIALGIEKVRR